jgi:hypothetical protein
MGTMIPVRFPALLFQLKHTLSGIYAFVVIETANNFILGRFLSENDIAVSSIIKKYIGSVVIGFFFGIGPLQMMQRYPKNADITWFRFAAWFFMIGVIEAVCVLCFTFFFESDMAKYLPLPFFALFFPVSNYIYGVILFILKWRKTNRQCVVCGGGDSQRMKPQITRIKRIAQMSRDSISVEPKVRNPS